MIERETRAKKSERGTRARKKSERKADANEKTLFGNGERYLDDEERPPVLVERERHDEMMTMWQRREATKF